MRKKETVETAKTHPKFRNITLAESLIPKNGEAHEQQNHILHLSIYLRPRSLKRTSNEKNCIGYPADTCCPDDIKLWPFLTWPR